MNRLAIAATLLMSTVLSAKGKKAAVISNEFMINAPIEQAWAVLGPGFEDAYKWAASVNHSEAKDHQSFNGSSCTERGCNVAGIGNILEKLLQYSATDHIISYQIYEGMPKMVKYASNTWKLTDAGGGKTKLEMTVEIKTGGLMGTLMHGMMVKKMKTLSKFTGEEFKYYVETNSPHERKLKAMKKAGK